MSHAKRSLPLRTLIVLCVLAPAAGFLRADEFWKEKPRSEWSLKQTLKLLTDSPWARQEIRAVARPESLPDAAFDNTKRHCDPDALNANGDCLQTRIRTPEDSSRNPRVEFSNGNYVVFLVRWESCAPVEDAFSRLAELGERATAEYVSAPLRLPADRYVVTLKTLGKAPTIGYFAGSVPPDSFGPVGNGATGPRARLIVEKHVVAAAESERSGLGAAEAVRFFFPRSVDGAPLIPVGRASRVTFEFRGGRFTVKTHFDLTPATLR
jgi:hypothetical protein